MKASADLEEVFVKCDNCSENFKTAPGLKDQYNQAHSSQYEKSW